MQWLAQKRGKLGVGDAGPQRGRRVGQGLQGVEEFLAELIEVVGAAIGQCPLGGPPDALIGIELGGVRWQGYEAQARLALPQRHQRRAAMNAGVVPDHEDRSAQVAEHVSDEVSSVDSADVGALPAVEETQALPLRADGDRRVDREPVASVVVLEDGRLPARRPGAAHRRDQEEAGFVGEDDPGTQPCGVFFTRGQVEVFQRAMAASSRSMARRSGRWCDQPS